MLKTKSYIALLLAAATLKGHQLMFEPVAETADERAGMECNDASFQATDPVVRSRFGGAAGAGRHHGGRYRFGDGTGGGCKGDGHGLLHGADGNGECTVDALRRAV